MKSEISRHQNGYMRKHKGYGQERGVSCQPGKSMIATRTVELMLAITSTPPLPSFEGFPYYCNTVPRKLQCRATRSRTRIWSLLCGSSLVTRRDAAAARMDERKVGQSLIVRISFSETFVAEMTADSRHYEGLPRK